MATLTLIDNVLSVRFTTAEKVLGLVRDHDFPLTAVTSARLETDGLGAARGLRSPGLGMPGLRKVGTWRGRRAPAGKGPGRSLVSVRRDAPAVVVELAGQRFDRLVISPTGGSAGGTDAAALVEQLDPRS